MNLTHLAENDLAQQNDRILARRTGLAGAIARFEEWMADPESPVRAIRRQPAKPGVFAEFPEALAPPLKQSLASRGIRQLYSHQAEALPFGNILAGRGNISTRRQSHSL